MEKFKNNLMTQKEQQIAQATKLRTELKEFKHWDNMDINEVLLDLNKRTQVNSRL